MLTRFHYILLAAACVLLFLGIAHQHDAVIDTIKQPWQGKPEAPQAPPAAAPPPPAAAPPPPPPPPPPPAAVPEGPFKPDVSFYDVGKKSGTDKVTTHHYWFMYDKYLGPIRHKKLKMLEIGLGCDMRYGPGKSLAAWLEYLPNVDLYYIEYDAACAAKWADMTHGAKIFAGDQANRTFLQEFLAKTGGNFDIIVDDGGHTMNQQITSIEELWSSVVPGGLYFCEDLHTSYAAAYDGDTKQGTDPAAHTMTKFIYELIDDRMINGNKHKISADMRSIDCMREICAFTKKEENTAN